MKPREPSLRVLLGGLLLVALLIVAIVLLDYLPLLLVLR